MLKPKLVLIGASTGGPGHLEKILSSLDKDYKNTIIIAQHMDFIFLPSLVSRMNEKTNIETLLVEEHKSIKQNTITFTQKDLTRLNYSTSKGLYITNSTVDRPYLPNVNCLFETASKLCNHFDILACLLTGIGDDGANGLLELHNAGAKCVGEDENSSIIYGMPKAALELNNKLTMLSLDDIIAKVQNF